jgi:hypothetical protein
MIETLVNVVDIEGGYAHSLPSGGRKQFFFEKKNQKTLIIMTHVAG